MDRPSLNIPRFTHKIFSRLQAEAAQAANEWRSVSEAYAAPSQLALQQAAAAAAASSVADTTARLSLTRSHPTCEIHELLSPQAFDTTSREVVSGLLFTVSKLQDELAVAEADNEVARAQAAQLERENVSPGSRLPGNAIG